MHTSIELRNALVTQKSKRNRLIYDSIQDSIDVTIQTLKTKQKNAIIRNLAYNIDGQLVVAQLFINRLNGFVPTAETKFGTMPTAYQIQLRFVHGYETVLGTQPIFISNGSFEWHNLSPQLINDHITDDIYHETVLTTGPQVTCHTTDQTLTLSTPNSPSISLPMRQEEGKGYEEFSFAGTPAKDKYYFNLVDYQQRHKLNTTYALCYTQANQEALHRWHPEYPGFTQAQEGIHESRHSTAEVTARLQAYRNWSQQIDTTLQYTPWARYHQRSRLEQNHYRLDILSVNGMYLYADSGLMVDRLYDYQVELVQLVTDVYQRIRANNQPNRLPTSAHMSIVDMGVGAGKTYIINTVLKSLSKSYLDPNYAPPFCMTPDKAIADVMVRVINKQDDVSQIKASAITGSSDMPDAAFIQRYQGYAQTALQEVSRVKDYIETGLQNRILEYCRAVGLHPFVIMNELYDNSAQCRLYQNSIDIKRLLLLIEGQKLIMQKTGLSPITALRRLYDDLEKIIQGVNKEQAENNSLFRGIDAPIQPMYPSQQNQIYYDQQVDLPRSLRTTKMAQINLKNMNAELLKKLLQQKFSYKQDTLQRLVAIRDVLLKIACLSDCRAAILLANGGGLANTHTQQQIETQIAYLLEPAATELRRGAEKKEPMNFLEHRAYFLYLNEIFSTLPIEIDARSQYRHQAGYDQILQASLRYNYQLLHNLRYDIAQQLAQLAQPQDIDSRYGATMAEAVDHMAGHLGLVLSGRLEGNAAKLLSTHVPVFNPEGFVTYLEHLARSAGQVMLTVDYQEGIYLLNPQTTTISKALIQQRLVQILSALMLADEIHKEAYQFLYDPNHPLYQRANQITQAYLNQEFGQILPHRIGMSGTVNQIAKNAFGQHTLYSLPLQNMIQRQLTKKFKITSLMLEQSQGIWPDYFLDNTWCPVSKGIVFSKTAQAYPSLDIDIERTYHDLHLHAIRNQLLIHYLEFILQKSGASKELSELVGLQNTLHALDVPVSLLAAFQQPTRYSEIPALQDIVRSLRNISPDLISETDVRHYVHRSLHCTELQEILTQLILNYKNNALALATALYEAELPIETLVTHDPNTFEDGRSQILLGTEAQQTGYSHEFVGAIVDASRLAIHEPLGRMGTTASELQHFYAQLQTLLNHSFSYDEKNQIGGRALRTSTGTACYIEYLSPNYAREFPFNIETSFADIFTEDAEQAKALRNSVMFNRMVLEQLRAFDGPFETFAEHIVTHCQTHHLLEDYQGLLADRLPAWWSLKYRPDLVLNPNYQDFKLTVNELLQGRHLAASAPSNRVPTSPGWAPRQVANQHYGPNESWFSATTWLQWMTQPLPIVIGTVLLLAGLSLLGSISLSILSGALVATCAKGMITAGSLLLLPILSKTCYSFFQSRAQGGNALVAASHVPPPIANTL